MHVVECARRLRVGLCAGQAHPVSAGPALGAEHRVFDVDSAGRDGCVGSVGSATRHKCWRADEGESVQGAGDSVEGALRRASALSAQPCGDVYKRQVWW